jgi:hypothetical protein
MQKREMKVIHLLTLPVSCLLVLMVIFAFESLPVSAVTDDVVVNQSVTTGISITSPADITMTALSTSQNTAVGSATWTVTTNSAGGYTLTLFASTAPALARSGGGGNIADYTPAVAETPETWSVPGGSVEFGFSAFGADVPTGTWGTDADCIAGADVPSATLKWRDFDLTGSADQVATVATVTTTSGTPTTMCVASEQDTIFASSGSYSATITATALAQ